MSKLLIALVVVIALVVGVVVFVVSSGSEESVSGDVKTFVLTGENFNFAMGGSDNPEIRVNEGDRVRIDFSSTDGFHDFVIDEFGAATQRVNEGGSTSVEFVVDKKGSFEYYCSVGQHRANGMWGVFVVE